MTSSFVPELGMTSSRFATNGLLTLSEITFLIGSVNDDTSKNEARIRGGFAKVLSDENLLRLPLKVLLRLTDTIDSFQMLFDFLVKCSNHSGSRASIYFQVRSGPSARAGPITLAVFW
jgi:hypothetical protein